MKRIATQGYQGTFHHKTNENFMVIEPNLFECETIVSHLLRSQGLVIFPSQAQRVYAKNNLNTIIECQK